MNDTQIIDLSGSNDDIARWVWKNLVPKSGQASTIQGEILRAIEKLRWEAQENGNVNWDNGFEKLLNFLETALCQDVSFSEELTDSIKSDLSRLRNFILPDKLKNRPQITNLPYIEDDLYNRLTGHLVSFCRQYPQAIPRQNDPEQYR